MARKGKTYEDLMKLAKDYSVTDNVIVLELAERYAAQKRVMEKMKTELHKNGLIVKKEYVKGRENLCANPLLCEWPKNCDSASRTLDALGDAILKFGTPPQKTGGKLGALMRDD